MAVAVRSNGLHHAVSLGAIEVSSKGSTNRNYDSEDDSNKRRLRPTSSTELYPRTSVYSKGDIREQYCLTDRQLNSIERPRRDRFFGCLSRRSAHRSQSFLGVCVGRRAPSDENLSSYAPFQKYPRYHQHKPNENMIDLDKESSYFRRQPASILSTGKMTSDASSSATDDNRPNWITQSNLNANKGVNFATQNLSANPSACPSYITPHSGIGITTAQPTTPRTKHVSFARSHTLTSFNDANLGFNSLERVKATQSQERLIGGKKPCATTGLGQPLLTETGTSPYTIHQHQHQHQHQHHQNQPQHQYQPHIMPTGSHMHTPSYNLQGGHSHQHHHLPVHIHQFVPTYNANYMGKVQTEQPIPLGVGVLACAPPTLPPLSPEVVVVEKKFRNAMKTQATQTDPRKEVLTLSTELSPRNVKVVSQGAQTNGLQNKLKMAKDSFEMPNVSASKTHSKEQQQVSGDISLSPAILQASYNGQNNIEYYERPSPPQSIYRRSSYPSIEDKDINGYNNDEERFHDMPPNNFEYESQSLPRNVCSHQYVTNEFISHSLPRHYTENSSYSYDVQELDFTKPHLLPPPRQYCKDSNDEEEEDFDDIEKDWSRPLSQVHAVQDTNRRKSLAAVIHRDAEIDSPFRRDDIRRQSMPVYVKTERLIDGYAPRSSFRGRENFRNRYRTDDFDEKEILIDFKPHMSPKPSPKLNMRHRKTQRNILEAPKEPKEQLRSRTPQKMCNASSQVSGNDDFENNNEFEEYSLSEDEHEEVLDNLNTNDNDVEDHLYENVPTVCSCYENVPEKKRDQFRKRSVSLDDAECIENKAGISSPPSPCREDIANASTYPSSDSLANDITRDHSDGIWNESQATVLTAEQKDPSDVGFLSSNQLLTPSSKRRNLILQHQQRSSVDTDALDFEDMTDHSPIYSNVSLVKPLKAGGGAGGAGGADDNHPFQSSPISSNESKSSFGMPTKTILPSIAITPIQHENNEMEIPEISVNSSPRQTPPTVPPGGITATTKRIESSYPKKRNIEKPNSSHKFNVTNTDISECSTNTDEYVTCTDTSKRTQGIKTPPTTTSSSSTTQVPVSTQSSQMEKSHGSSFESASSLHSSRGEILVEDVLLHDENSSNKMKTESLTQVSLGMADMLKKSPTHSMSSTSSESYKAAAPPIASAAPYSESTKNVYNTPAVSSVSISPQQREKPRPKIESISDDERSEMRYSSSGYYESPPHDDVETLNKGRRHRLDEERKRRKTSMKLDIEKENMRALTSPIRKPPSSGATTDKMIDASTGVGPAMETSPNKMKRFRPKVRRQLRKSSREDSTPRRPKSVLYYSNIPTAGNTEKLLDCSIKASSVTSPSKVKDDMEKEKGKEKEIEKEIEKEKEMPKPIVIASAMKSASEGAVEASAGTARLKAKSTESLRSVSPGSDSVFYSEADGTTANDQHCQHCGKEMEGESAALSIGAGDSVESIPYIENEEQVPDQDIVKPPSDFADSPVITKTTQRLYKKMDRRFRSEERGRHYKTRQENIRAKSEERNREQSVRSPQTLRPSGSSPCVLPEANFEQNQQVIYRGHYDIGRYARLTDADVWAQLDHQSFDRHRDRRASTESEKSFHSKYQVILHRLVQRRCTLEMYHRQKNNEFEQLYQKFLLVLKIVSQGVPTYYNVMIELISSSSPQDSVRHKLEEVLKLMLLLWARENYVLDRITNSRIGVDKTVVVKSDSGEFGFRIHGSKPVVVAAIEPDTPAESSGLEVGDIIISVNGIQVLDKHHTEVVKIAHDGCETLELKVARTIGVLMNEQHDPPSELIYSGYLWRQSGQAKGLPNAKKWVRRWFCLRSDNCLYYYKTESSTQPVGAMIMSKHIVEQCTPEVGKPYAFKVDSGEGIPLFVAGDSEELSNSWVKVLRQAAAQANPWLDNCARYLYQQPNSITRPDCFGYLLKLGSRWCGWSRRYCVLKNACLYFYQDGNSKAAFGMACLQGYKVATMSTNASGKKNSFEVIPPEPKLRHYYFCAESEMDKKRWISALEYSIDRWIKSG